MAEQTDVDAVATDVSAEAPGAEADTTQPNSLDEALGSDGQLAAEIEQTLAGTEADEGPGTDRQGAADIEQPLAGPDADAALGTDGRLAAEIAESLAGTDTDAAPVSRLELDELESSPGESKTMRDLDLLADVEVEVAVEFGRTRLPLRQLLTLRRGSLVEMARRPEQQVTVLANGTPIALGDIVVVGEHIGVHIVELIDVKQAPVVEQPPLPQADVIDPAETDPAEPTAGDGHAGDDS